MYARRAAQLLQELSTCEEGQLPPYNSDKFDQVIRECEEHSKQFQSLIREKNEKNSDIEAKNEDHYGSFIHHLSLIRNKRCLMAYVYKRAEVIQTYRWKVGRVLPNEIHDKLNFAEQDYFKNHCAVIDSYTKDLDLDLTVDIIPPKDPYIRVRVVSEIGEVSLGDHSVSLSKDSLHSLRRTDAEPFISQGLMEEFME
ncbi:partner of SLD five 1 [Carex rostrata]